ncbi:Cro/CI family transcriptional regulator [Halopseudomonas sp.]|uniref:Cro/CI family transcriptional regulator n=1 Tax=Halopseudomonas sp. TaxID=2901191 RepID=UPI00311E3C7A
MQRTTLTEFSKKHGQTEAARLLGMSQGSLNKALKVGREVYVTKTDDGYEAEEVRPFPTTRRETAA